MIEQAIEQVVRKAIREELAHFLAPAATPRDTGPSDDTKTLSVGQAGELLGVSKNAMYRLVKEQQLVALRIGNRIRVPGGPSRSSSGGNIKRRRVRAATAAGTSAARYRRSGNEAIAPVDLCAARRCHERLLDDLSTVGALG